jgi:hypothetical protein
MEIVNRRPRRRSVPRLILVVAVVAAVAISSAGCGKSLPLGKVLFSTGLPTVDDNCAPSHQVTSVNALTSVYATYVFKSTPGSEVLSVEITEGGTVLFPKSPLEVSNTQGKDCIGLTDDLSMLSDWAPGTAHAAMTDPTGKVVAEGDLTITS